MDDIEMAQDGMETAHEHHKVPHARKAAIVIAVLAAGLAIAEMGEKSAQNGYLASHISASDTWAQYQAKSIRSANYATVSATYGALAKLAPSDSIRSDFETKVDFYAKESSRMRSEPGKDGMEQLSERAKELEHQREHQLHVYHGLESATGGLQISIVLASVSVVTGVRTLLVGGGILGLCSALYGILAASSAI